MLNKIRAPAKGTRHVKHFLCLHESWLTHTHKHTHRQSCWLAPTHPQNRNTHPHKQTAICWTT